MKRTIILGALLVSTVPLRAADADDVQFYRAAKKIAAAAQKHEFTAMLVHLARNGIDMGPGDGWFKPGEARYSWQWLSARHGGKDKIAAKEFDGPPDLFARLDRDRDGFLTASDFDWSERSPYNRQMSQAQQWLRQRSTDGKLTRDEWDELFKQLAQGKPYLDADDVRALLNPPAPPGGQRRPNEKPPSKALLIQGLLSGEVGSIFEGPRLGQKAPDFTLPTHDGKKTITLSNYFKQHKPVVLVFGSFT
jgi:hypothetical protein